jgi:hypothetical protein
LQSYWRVQTHARQAANAAKPGLSRAPLSNHTQSALQQAGITNVWGAPAACLDTMAKNSTPAAVPAGRTDQPTLAGLAVARKIEQRKIPRDENQARDKNKNSALGMSAGEISRQMARISQPDAAALPNGAHPAAAAKSVREPGRAARAQLYTCEKCKREHGAVATGDAPLRALCGHAVCGQCWGTARLKGGPRASGRCPVCLAPHKSVRGDV